MVGPKGSAAQDGLEIHDAVAFRPSKTYHQHLEQDDTIEESVDELVKLVGSH